MELQRFVTKVIEELGGVVIPVEYALCKALVPDEYEEYFQGKTEAVLCFDFEVAQENPEAEFVTFGSHLLDKLIEITYKKTISSLRYGVVDRLSLSNPMDKIKRFLGLERADVEISSERPVMGMWAVFTFRVGYVSDERVEEVRGIWADLLTGEPSPYMGQAQVFYETKPLYNYPVPVDINIPHAFENAFRQVRAEAQSQERKHGRKEDLEREIQRIKDYYEDLEEENHKKMDRKGISEERIQELVSKGKSLELEREKQIREMEDKYTIKVDIALDHGVVYAIPGIEYRAVISFRGAKEERILYYNPVVKSF